MLYSAQTSSFCLAQLRLLTRKLFRLRSEKAFQVTLAVCSSAGQRKATAADGAAALTLHSTSTPAACQAGQLRVSWLHCTSQLRLCVFTPTRARTSTKRTACGIGEVLFFPFFFSISYNNTDVTEYIVLQTQSTPPPPPPPPWLLLP